MSGLNGGADDVTLPAATRLAAGTQRPPKPMPTTNASVKKLESRTKSDSENPPPRVTDGRRGKIPLGVLAALIGTPRVTVGKIRRDNRDRHLPHRHRGHLLRVRASLEREALLGTLKAVLGSQIHTPKAVKVRNDIATGDRRQVIKLTLPTRASNFNINILARRSFQTFELIIYFCVGW